MSFEKGKMNFSVIRLAGYDPETFLENLKSESYKTEEPSVMTPVIDITSGVSLAQVSDPEGVTEDDFIIGGMPYFAVRKSELKVDASAVREMLERRIFDIEKSGTPVDSRKKTELKEEIVEALEMDAVKKVSGTRGIVHMSGKFMLIESTSQSKTDDFIDSMYSLVEMKAFGGSGGLSMMSPNEMYLRISGRDPLGYIPVKMNGFETESGIGNDFLTYLFMASEIKDFLDDGVEITFSGDIEMQDQRLSPCGSIHTLLKKGTPSLASEIMSAFSSGKKLSSADLMITFGGDVYCVTVDSNFHFKKFYIKDESKSNNVHEKMESRMASISMFLNGFAKLFEKFLSTEDKNEMMIKVWFEEREQITA